MTKVKLRGQGYVLIELGRLDEAQTCYEASLKIEPDSTLAQSGLRYIRQQRDRGSRSRT